MESCSQPPKDARRIYSWDQTPNLTAPATYVVQDEGQEPRSITVSKNMRRVLEALMRNPIYAASYCRISCRVLELRHDYGVEIECVRYQTDLPTKRQTFGVYFLRSKVTPLAANEVAA